MKKYSLILLLILLSFFSFSQTRVFELIKDIEATKVISQDATGTCWSFSTSYFLESEIIRLNNKRVDLSEMFNVRHTYNNKSWNYVMRQGKLQFSQGSLIHNVINSISEFGFIPNSEILV